MTFVLNWVRYPIAGHDDKSVDLRTVTRLELKEIDGGKTTMALVGSVLGFTLAVRFLMGLLLRNALSGIS